MAERETPVLMLVDVTRALVTVALEGSKIVPFRSAEATCACGTRAVAEVLINNTSVACAKTLRNNPIRLPFSQNLSGASHPESCCVAGKNSYCPIAAKND